MSGKDDNIKKKKKDYLETTEKLPTLDTDFTTVSGEDVGLLYTPDDIDDLDYMKELGFPGEYPYTRGVHPNMYRGKLWTMRMFAGMGSAKDTNNRFHYLLKGGQTGLSTAFDLPTLYGHDSDASY
jgi:methylmalonyl-CoA mutase N-terminal domain/subunit